MSTRSDLPAAAAAPVLAEAPGNSASSTVAAERAELHRQGAKAAARGDASASNPMFEAINKPQATGESEQVWSDRRDAWERGHETQRSPKALQTHAFDGAAIDEPALDEALFGATRVLTFAGEKALTGASGFFFEREGRLFLVTSRHVLFDGPTQHAPDRIEVEFHTDADDLTQWSSLSIPLHRDGFTAWRHARDGGGEIDVAVVELDRAALPSSCVVQPFGPQHLPLGFELFEVGDRLAIPAFPLGFFDTVHHLPVVRQASVASCYGIRFQGLGYFLTDARMHRGSSGSPVLARVHPVSAERPRWCLLGVHSSRMDMATRDAALDESLGLNCAWYADVLMSLTTDVSAA